MEVYALHGQLNNGVLVPFFEGGGVKCETIHPNGTDISASSLCLGDFDGVHKGHAEIMKNAKGSGKKWGVLLFDRNTKGAKVLSTLSEKLDIIAEFGADYVIVAEFNEGFASIGGEEFVRCLKEVFGIKCLVCGYDYRFGYKAQGDTQMLVQLCRRYGMEAVIVNAVTDGVNPIKSTSIRELLKSGDLEGVRSLLGRPYTVCGRVVMGCQNGRKLGFPTANIDVAESKLLPPDGVYKGRAQGLDAVINIGKNPTFSASKRTVEAHIIDFDGELYDTELKAELLEKIRDEIKFSDIDGLVNQIREDIKSVKGR